MENVIFGEEYIFLVFFPRVFADGKFLRAVTNDFRLEGHLLGEVSEHACSCASFLSSPEHYFMVLESFTYNLFLKLFLLKL